VPLGTWFTDPILLTRDNDQSNGGRKGKGIVGAADDLSVRVSWMLVLHRGY
jgi:hypothetical protein